MRGVLAAILTVSALVAGCGAPSLPDEPRERDGNGRDGGTQLPDAAPPTVDSGAFMADYEAFVTQHPLRWGTQPDHEGARQAIAAAFAAAGLQVWRQDFTATGRGGEQQLANVAGIQWGTVRDQIVVVGSHFDSIHIECAISGPEDCLAAHEAVRATPAGTTVAVTQGAYDDGSGTAIVLYLAKLFAPLPAAYTVVYVPFDGEEEGLLGSAAFVDALLSGDTPLGDVTLRAMVDLDMYGLNWPGVNAPIRMLHNSPPMQAAVEEAAAELGIPAGMVVYGDLPGGGSDFDNFRSLGDTAFFDSSFGHAGTPAPAPAGTVPAPAYPFWHIADNWATMTAAAGGPANLEAGFGLAVGLQVALLDHIAFGSGFVPEEA